MKYTEIYVSTGSRQAGRLSGSSPPTSRPSIPVAPRDRLVQRPLVVLVIGLDVLVSGLGQMGQDVQMPVAGGTVQPATPRAGLAAGPPASACKGAMGSRKRPSLQTRLDKAKSG